MQPPPWCIFLRPNYIKFSLPLHRHGHLDGSLRWDTLYSLLHADLSLRAKKYSDVKTLRSHLSFYDGMGFGSALDSFITSLSVLQTRENITRVAREYCEDLVQRDGVSRVDVRYSPPLHMQRGLGIEEVVEAIHEGMQHVMTCYPDFQARQTLCMIRSPIPGQPMQEVLDTAMGIVDYALTDHAKDHLVTGLDLAALEWDAEKATGYEPDMSLPPLERAQYEAVQGIGFAPLLFQEHFRKAHEGGLRITIHAGEGGAPAEYIRQAIEDCHAERIGHAVSALDDPYVLSLIKEKEIVLELCPTSNVQTKTVSSFASHPVAAFYDQGIPFSIEFDNRSFSNCPLKMEYLRVKEHFPQVDLTKVDAWARSAWFGERRSI